MMRRFILLMAVVALTGGGARANLLANPGFEVEGSSEERAKNWEDNEQGGVWGNTVRTDWQAHRGTHAAAIRGAWSGADYAGFWQTCPVVEGSRYVLTAAFMWDNEWASDVLQLRIEWFKDGEKIGDEKKDLRGLPEGAWTMKSFAVQAPPGADSAHVVLDASGIQQEGVLYVDEVSFERE